MDEVIIFEEMPQAITALLCKVETMQNDINELKRHKAETPAEYIIGIDEACKILHRAKSTVYSMMQAHNIPFYQPDKMLQFKHSELMVWMESYKQATYEQTITDMAEKMQQGISHKPKKSWGTFNVREDQLNRFWEANKQLGFTTSERELYFYRAKRG